MLGGEGLIAEADWPVADPELLQEDTVTMPVQVNGKRRSELQVPRGTAREEIERLVLEDPAVARHLEGNAPKRLVIVPERIINVVL